MFYYKKNFFLGPLNELPILDLKVDIVLGLTYILPY